MISVITRAETLAGFPAASEPLARKLSDTFVSKVWSCCTTPRDDGVSYGDCLEQLTSLIFLKMAEEIIENLEAGLSSFRQVLAGLGSR